MSDYIVFWWRNNAMPLAQETVFDYLQRKIYKGRRKLQETKRLRKLKRRGFEYR